MAKAKAKKRQDVENELVKHSDLIADPKVKQYIMKKKEEKRQKEIQKWQKQGAMRKDVDMLMEDSEEEIEVEEVKMVETVKAKKTAAKTKAIGKK